MRFITWMRRLLKSISAREIVRCSDCKRPLKGKAAEAGIGPACAKRRKERAEAAREAERELTGMKGGDWK